jgi:hypothetical protein
MTVLEIRAIAALRAVRIPAQRWHASCAGKLDGAMASDPSRELGLVEAADLWFLVWTYRRQIADRQVVAHADEIVNGAMHLAL